MKVICLDGTTIECERFRAIDEGVLIFDAETGEETEADEATGFVPHSELRYVLPDRAQPTSPEQEAPQQQLGQGASSGRWVQGQSHMQEQPPQGTAPPGQPTSPPGEGPRQR